MAFPMRKLGKRPAVHDPRTLRLALHLAANLPAIPDELDRTAGVPFQMWGNDTYGCCAWAAWAALVEIMTKASQSIVCPTTDMVLDGYATTGFDPKTGANDNGTVLLDQFKTWSKNGLLRPGQTRDFVSLYGSIPLGDWDAMRRAIAYLGGAMIGVVVPKGFLDLAPGQTWDWNKLSAAAQEPDGGHALGVGGFRPDGLWFNTWGERTFMPKATYLRIADEAWGFFHRQNWLGINGQSPMRESDAALRAELEAA